LVFCNISSPDYAFVKKAIAEFESSTGITVSLYKQLPYTSTLEAGKDYLDNLYAEMMSGNGPDVFISFTDFDYHLYKMMESGVFANFDDLIDSDDDFYMDRFEKTLMDTGVFYGNRYIMPLTYTVPVSFVSQERMREFNITRSDIKDYESLLDTSLAFQGQDKMLFTSTWSKGFAPFYGGWLQEVIDYENQTVNIDIKTIDRCMDVIRNEKVLHNKYGGADEGRYINVKEFENGLLNLVEIPNAQMMFLSSIVGNDVIEVLPLPNYFGNSTAAVHHYSMISSSSVNINNAWEFVKILLGETCQCEESLETIGIGVAGEYIDANLDRIAAKYGAGNRVEVAQLKSLYKTYDNTLILGIHSGMIAGEYLADYVWSDTPPDLSELKETLAHEVTFWFSE